MKIKCSRCGSKFTVKTECSTESLCGKCLVVEATTTAIAKAVETAQNSERHLAVKILKNVDNQIPTIRYYVANSETIKALGAIDNMASIVKRTLQKYE